jgi:hypothetical protein
MAAEADLSPATATARFAQLVNDEVEVTLRSKASVIGKLIQITSEEKGLVLRDAITTNVDGSTSHTDEVIVSGKDVVTMSSRRVADKFRESQRKPSPGIAIGGGEDRAQPLVTEMKGVNALNLEPALPKLDEKTRSEWIATKEQQKETSILSGNVSNLQREFQSSLMDIDSKKDNQARAAPTPTATQSQTRTRHKVSNASVPQQRSRNEEDRRADPDFSFNPHASTFTPTNNTGGRQNDFHRAEVGGGSKADRSKREKSRSHVEEGVESGPKFTPLVANIANSESNLVQIMNQSIESANKTSAKAESNFDKSWPEATGDEMIRTFGDPTVSAQQVFMELNRLRANWVQKHGLPYSPAVVMGMFPPGAQGPPGAVPMIQPSHQGGGLPLVGMVPNPMNPQQLVAMGGQHGQTPGQKAPPQQPQVPLNSGPSMPSAQAQQHNMSPQPDSGPPVQPPHTHQQPGMMGPMGMPMGMPVPPGGQMMQMMPGMPQVMGMGPNPMQGMPSGQTPPQGQNQAGGAYPPSQGMQPMMPQGMQGMEGQMPNPQMQQQQQYMFMQMNGMNPQMMQQMHMAQMQGGGQQMMMPGMMPAGGMGGMPMQQGSPPQVDGNNGPQMGGYAPYNMGMPMGTQQQPGQ